MAPQQAQQQPVPQQQAVAAEGMIIDGEPVELNEQILNEVVWETISAVFTTGGAAISTWIVSIYTIVKNALAMAGDAIAKWIKGGFAPTPIPTKTATDNIPSSVGSGVIKGGVVATPNIGRHSVPQVGDVTVKGGNSNTPNIKTGLPTIGNKR
jgi:hypothetical protein